MRHIDITSPYSYSSYFHANCKYMFHAPSFCGQLHFPRSPIIQLFRTGNVQLPHGVHHNVQLPHGVQHNVQCNASTSPGCAIQCEIRVVVFNFYRFFHNKVGFFWGGIFGFVYLQRRVHTKLGDLTKRFDCALWGSNSGRRSDTTIYHLLFTLHNSQFIISNIVLLSERRSSKEGAHRITIGPTTMPNSTARSTGVHHRHPVCAAQCTRSTPSLQCARPT